MRSPLSSRGITGRWMTADSLRLFCRVSHGVPQNDIPNMVLVHGLGVSSRYMVPLLQELAPLYPTWAPDLPGFGRSERTSEVPDIPALAGWLRKWLASAGLKDAVFIGNSMGCQIIAEMAAFVDPMCVRAAVFLGPTMDPSAKGPQAHIFRLLRDQFHEPAALLPLQAFDYLGNGPIRTFKTFAHALKHDMLRASAHVKSPTLLVRGENDPIVPFHWMEQLSRAIKGSRVATVPKAGHALNYNSPREVTRLVREFLATIQPT